MKSAASEEVINGEAVPQEADPRQFMALKVKNSTLNLNRGMGRHRLQSFISKKAFEDS